MSYEVLARKWRPKNFSELLGQDSVRQTLSNALKQNRLYPVLLFTGPRGTGKTSSARILAKSLRCPHQKNLIPCDQCEDCRLIQDSRHLDVIEIDGASNNGVEAVRELRDTVSYMPSTGSWKIYIIDEVHMLSNSAFNALLKTFEEPPENVLFIMATTESRKIPATVLSRAQRLDFNLLPPQLIKKQLESICKKEKISIPEEALWIISKQAGGSLRDAQSLLDQVITFCGEDLSSEKVTNILGLSDPHILSQCLQAIIHRKEEQMINVIANLRSKGSEPKLFLQSLIEALSQYLFLKKNPSNGPELVSASKQEIEQIKEEIEGISYEDLHFLFDMLLKGEREMAFCHDSQLVLEVLLLRFCGAPRLETVVPLKSLSEEKKKIEKEFKPETSSLKPEIPNLKLETPSFKPKPEAPSLKAKPPSLKPETQSPLPQAPSLKAPSDLLQNKASDEDFEERFDFLEFLRKKDQALTALVENLCLKKKSFNHFYFAVPESFSYLKNKITEPSLHEFLEKQLTEFLNSKERVKIEVLNNESESLNLREEKKIMEKHKLLNQAKKNPFVNEVKDLFEGEIKSVIKNPK